MSTKCVISNQNDQSATTSVPASSNDFCNSMWSVESAGFTVSSANEGDVNVWSMFRGNFQRVCNWKYKW